MFRKSPYGNCSHYWEQSIFLLRKMCLNHVLIYSQINRIRIRYSNYQFIIQNTPAMSNYISKIQKKTRKAKINSFQKI